MQAACGPRIVRSCDGDDSRDPIAPAGGRGAPARARGDPAAAASPARDRAEPARDPGRGRRGAREAGPDGPVRHPQQLRGGGHRGLCARPHRPAPGRHGRPGGGRRDGPGVQLGERRRDARLRPRRPHRDAARRGAPAGRASGDLRRPGPAHVPARRGGPVRCPGHARGRAAGPGRRARPRSAFALHIFTMYPASTISIRPGPIMASADTLRIVIRGRGGHASNPSGRWTRSRSPPSW